MSRRRGVLSAAALFLLLALAGFGCRGAEEEAIPMPEAPTRSPDEGMRGVTLRNFQVGETEWVLEADSASVFREKKTVVARRVRIDFYEGDKHVSRLLSDEGILNQATDDLEARGHVRVTTDEGAVLTTEILFWDHQAAKIHTDEDVEIIQGENRISGRGFEADPGLERIELRRQVRGTLREQPEGILRGAPDSSGAES